MVKSGSRAVHDSREVLTVVACVNAGGKVRPAHLSIPVNNFMALSCNRLNLSILEILEQVHRQTVKTLMKCRIMRHFIKVYTVC